MRPLLSIILIVVLCVACGSNDYKRRDVRRGEVALDSCTRVIKLDPDPNKELLFSQIVNDIKIIPLETAQASLLSTIRKIDLDGKLYFIQNDHDRLVYVFDTEGNFLNRIGQIGRGPGEMLFPRVFALDRVNKEVIMVDNFKTMLRYEYDGTYIDSDPMKLIFFADFMIANSGDRLYHTSKLTNYDDDKSPIPYNLWIDETGKSDEFSMYFPYDYEIFPNGSMRIETKTPFSVFGDTVRYHYNFSDIIYDYRDGVVSPAWYVDFGDKGPTVDLNKLNSKEIAHYLAHSKHNAAFFHGVIETEKWLRLYYLLGEKRAEVFFDKVNNKIFEGVFVDDIFDNENIQFFAHRNGKLVGWFLPGQMKLQQNAKLFFDPDTLERLNNMAKDDNPILLEVSLKI